MSTVTASRPVRKSTHKRVCKLVNLAGKVCLVLKQFRKKGQLPEVDAYSIEPVVSQFGGRGFELLKPEGDSYHILLSGSDTTCDCRGFVRHGHCKHSSAMLALEAAGKLD